MNVGVFTPLLSGLGLDEVLKVLKGLDITSVELGTGNYPGDAHCKRSMLEQPAELTRFKQILADHGATISALSCHGNPLHPDPARARAAQEVSRDTILLAEALGVATVVDFSGCPGDAPGAKAPNWVTCAWPPEFLEVLDWQWNEVLAPYWIRQARFAADHGVRIAIEMHPGFNVYSPETLLRLREIAGPSLGANLDPSHLFWQGIDPLAAVGVLGEAIYHVHAKDTRMHPANLARTGVLDTRGHGEGARRGWTFCTCGDGHDEGWWRAFAATLKGAGYQGVLSIEHEDALLAPLDGLGRAAALLQRIVG